MFKPFQIQIRPNLLCQLDSYECIQINISYKRKNFYKWEINKKRDKIATYI